jgi:hypothetical protein
MPISCVKRNGGFVSQVYASGREREDLEVLSSASIQSHENN